MTRNITDEEVEAAAKAIDKAYSRAGRFPQVRPLTLAVAALAAAAQAREEVGSVDKCLSCGREPALFYNCFRRVDECPQRSKRVLDTQGRADDGWQAREIDELHSRAYDLSRVVLDRDSCRDDFCDRLRDLWPTLRTTLVAVSTLERQLAEALALLTERPIGPYTEAEHASRVREWLKENGGDKE